VFCVAIEEEISGDVPEPIVNEYAGNVAALAVVPTHLVASINKAKTAEAVPETETELVAEEPFAKYPFAFVTLGRFKNAVEGNKVVEGCTVLDAELVALNAVPKFKPYIKVIPVCVAQFVVDP
jgi:hypothetical protein